MMHAHAIIIPMPAKIAITPTEWSPCAVYSSRVLTEPPEVSQRYTGHDYEGAHEDQDAEC